MPKRKTIEISELVEMANKLFLHSQDDLKGSREGVAAFLADTLQKTGNYQGFRYLTEVDMKSSEYGNSVGIIPDRTEGGRGNKYPDESRRVYYV